MRSVVVSEARLYICPDTLVKEYNDGKTLRELGEVWYEALCMSYMWG